MGRENTLPEEGYIDALPKIREAIEGLAGIDDNRQYLEEAFLRAVEILTPAKMFDGDGDKGSRRGPKGDGRLV